MLIIYRKGEVLNQIVAWGADRERKIEGRYLRFGVECQSDLDFSRARSCSHLGRSNNSSANPSTKEAR